MREERSSEGKIMQDIQSGPAEVALPIDRVGVRDLEAPIVVRDRAEGSQHTVARVEMSCDLPASFKGTHMSRFVETLGEWSGELDYKSFKRLLGEVRRKLQAKRAHVRFAFPYFQRQTSPASGAVSLMSFHCQLWGELDDDAADGKPRIFLRVETPVMTVCPCSLAICETGAHSQRAMARIEVECGGFVWIEDLVRIAQDAASSPVYSLLKREDEKRIIEQAFAKPTFVEDVARGIAQTLQDCPEATWFRVEVESFESIHNHSAFATIEKRLASR